MSEIKQYLFKGKFIIEVSTFFETKETSDNVARMLHEDLNDAHIDMTVWGIDKVMPLGEDSLGAENVRLRKSLEEAVETIDVEAKGTGKAYEILDLSLDTPVDVALQKIQDMKDENEQLTEACKEMKNLLFRQVLKDGE